jgi:hypothetical protein
MYPLRLSAQKGSPARVTRSGLPVFFCYVLSADYAPTLKRAKPEMVRPASATTFDTVSLLSFA